MNAENGNNSATLILAAGRRCLLLPSSSIVFILVVGLISGTMVPALGKDDWEPIPPEELALQDDPLNPGAHAIILSLETFTNHEKHYETNYRRIKILTEKGKKYGNVEIPLVKKTLRVKDLAARVVHPDGRAVAFVGEVYEKPVVKSKRLQVLVKTFSLPDVDVGSIVEYRFTYKWDPYKFFPPGWFIQSELTLRLGNFRLKPYTGGSWNLGWNMWLFPEGDELQPQEDGTFRLLVEDVPAFQEEKYMPPEGELKMRTTFFYKEKTLMESDDAFWKRIGRERYEEEEKFIRKDKGIDRVVAQLISPNDPPKVKLRKLYARAQQVRNLSYERRKTQKEEKRKKLKENKSVKDVLKRGYGDAWDINRLFVALARAAGFDASVVLLAERSSQFFHKNLRDPDELNAQVVVVRLGREEIYLDPASACSPFGLLSWDQTGVTGLRLEKEGGVFAQSPAPKSSDAVTERRAQLTLDMQGTLAGKVQVLFHGQEALRKRLDALDEDGIQRREELEEEIESWLPTGAKVEIERAQNWESSEEPLQVEFSLELPNFAIATGRRLLLPVGIFQMSEKHPRVYVKRVHPVYFRYPWQEKDEITLTLPPGFQVEGTPPEHMVPTQFSRYESSCEEQENRLLFRRLLVMNGVFFKKEYYPVLRRFFTEVKVGDEQNVVLEKVELGQLQ